VNPLEHLTNLCHLAKNLYNLGNWYLRQDLFNLNNALSYYDLNFMLKHEKAYRNLPSQTSQQILKLIIKNWKSYFKAIQDYRLNPRTSQGLKINADVNGAYNIMKKAFPNSIKVDGIEAFGLMPQIIQQNIVDTLI